jgi:poly-gamma-glutamate synthesis protein (capsule biosynthesis protein)
MRGSSYLAGLLNYSFRMISDNVRLIQTTSGSETFEQMMSLCEDDVFFAISFPRYSKSIIRGVEYAKSRGADVIALTDSENRIKKFGPNLKGPKTTADTMKASGITDCLLSNNHIFDFGKEGAHDTIAQLDRVGLGYTGYGDNYEASRKNMFIEKDGVTVGIVNVCEHEYTYATDVREGARPFDEFETMNDIREAKKRADFVIVAYHGGKELCRYPSPRLMKACREMIRCGASAVFCQHSHCIGCYEEFEGGHILYGQGNFHFSECFDDVMVNEGLVACLDIEKDGLKIEYVPVKSTEVGIRLATKEEKDSIMSDIYARNAQIIDGTWLDSWRQFCQKVFKGYNNARAGKVGPREHYSVEDTEKEYQLFAHYLDCEAHTDVWRELFRTYNHTNELD